MVERPLIIRNVEFIGGMAGQAAWRPDTQLPEVAFAGRSNVGKSSLLNRLIGRKKMARVSNTPGRTREVNFFRINDAFVLADLPGYGYARASKDMREAWKPLIESYLSVTTALRGVVLLLDARRDPTPDDLLMRSWLGELGVPTLIALTKTDKLRAAEVKAREYELAKAMEVDEDQVVVTSAESGLGRDDLAIAVESLLAAPAWR
jgi:GTP-binding protein